MFRAALETGDGWTITRNLETVLEHEGRLIVADTEEDWPGVLETLEAETGKFVNEEYNTLKFTSRTLYRELGCSGSWEELETTGSVLVNGTHYHCSGVKTKGQQVWVFEAPSYWESDEGKKYDNIVWVKDEEGYLAKYDPDLWKSAKRRQLVLRNRSRRKALPTTHALYQLNSTLAAELGTRGDKLCLRDTWILIAAHDAAFGRRATNKHLLPLARAWNRNPEKAERQFTRWVELTHLEWMSKRLATVSRVSKLEKPAN